MEFICIAPPKGRLVALRHSVHPIRFADHYGVLPKIIAGSKTAVLILELCQDTDIDAACQAVDRWGRQLPIWILDPSATVASSVGWIKGGAAHVAVHENEIIEQIRTYPVSYTHLTLPTILRV